MTRTPGEPQRVLVTGAAGFFGSHLCSALLDAGYDVTGLVRQGSDCARLRPLEGRLHVRSLARQEPVASLFDGRGFDAVVHAATNYGRTAASQADLVHDNVVFPLAIAEAHERSSPSGFFVNLDSFFSRSGRESLHLYAYTTSKRHLREWLGMRRPESVTVNLHLEHLYGPGDSPQKFVPWLLNQLVVEGAARVPLTDGSALRDFIYVSDAAAAVLLVIREASRHRPGLTDYEVGTGKAITVREFATLAHALSGSNAVLDFGAIPPREGELKTSQADNSALLALGWAPTHTPAQGVRQCLDSLRSRSP